MIKNYLIVSLLCSFFGFSQFNPTAPWMQNMNTPKTGQSTIDEQVEAFNKYWSTRDKNARGSGYKPFMRWEYHWRNYANEQGYIMSSEDFWEAWRQKKQVIANRRSARRVLPASNWQPVSVYPYKHGVMVIWSRASKYCSCRSNELKYYLFRCSSWRDLEIN